MPITTKRVLRKLTFCALCQRVSQRVRLYPLLRTNHLPFPPALVTAASVVAIALSPAARAQTFTWSAGGGTNSPYWSTASNWGSGFPNGNNSNAVFSGSATLSNLTARLDRDVQLASLTFNTGTSAKSFIITDQDVGGVVHDWSISIGSGGITNNTALTQTISALINLNANQSFTTVTGGTLQLASSTYNQVDMKANTLTIAGAGTTNIQSNIVNSSGTGKLVKNDSGTLTLTGTNTYTGGTTINGGSLNVGTSNISSSLGTGSVTINGGRLAFGGASSGGSATITNNGTLQFWDSTTASNTTIVNNSSGLLDLSVHNGSIIIGQLSGAGNVSLGNNALTLGIKSTDDIISGNISGSGSLVKTGFGVLTLTAANMYTGGTTISGGLLNVGTATISGSLGTGAVTINSPGIVAFGASSDAGTAGITNGGMLRFWNTSTASNTTITNSSGGVVDISPHNGGMTIGQLSGAGSVFLGGNTLTLGGKNTDDTISGVLSDGGYLGGTGGNLVKTGTGTLTLSGNSTFTGGTTISAGALYATNANALGTGAVINSGVLQFTGVASGTFLNAITGSGGVTISESTLTLSGANTFTGGLTVRNGATVTLTADQASGAGAINVLGEAGGIAISGSSALAGRNTTLNVNSSNLSTITSLTIQAGEGGASSVNRTAGAGGNAIFNSSAQTALSSLAKLNITGGNGGSATSNGTGGAGGTALFTASTSGALSNLTNLTLTGGDGGSQLYVVSTGGTGGDAIFTLGVSDSGIGANTSIVLAPGLGNQTIAGSAILSLNSYSLSLASMETMNAITSNRAVIRNDGSTNSTLTVGFDNTNRNFGGTLQNGSGTGTLALVKAGSGDLTLSGNSTYSGGTTINSGVLYATHANALGTGTVTNNGALVFTNTANGTLSNAITGAGKVYISGSTLTLSSSDSTFTGGLEVSTGATVTMTEARAAGTGIISVIGGGGSGGRALGNGAVGKNTTLNANAAALSALTELTLQGGTGGPSFGTSLGGNGGIPVLNLPSQTALANLTTLNLVGGQGAAPGATVGNTNGMGGTSTFIVSASGALSNLTKLTLTAGSGGAGFFNNGGNGGNAIFTLGMPDSGLSEKTAVVFAPGQANKGGVGIALFNLNSYSLNLAGIETVGGAVGSNMILQNGGEGSSTLTVGSDNANHAFGGTLQDGNTGTFALVKIGTGTQTLSGNSTYTGGTSIQSGVLGVGSNTALGTGRVTLIGGTIQSMGGAHTVSNAITLSAASSLSSGTVNTADPKTPGLTLAGNVTLGSDSGLNVTGNTRVAITGVVGEDSLVRTLVKDGTGTLVLTNDNTYTGGTLVRSGTLVVNNAYHRTPLGSGTGEGAVTVAKGATLTGTFAISGALQINSGGILGIGNSIGHSSVSSLGLVSGSLLDFEIGDDGISSDRLDIASLLSKSGTSPITFLLSGEHLADGTQKGISEGTFTLLAFGFQSGVKVSDFQASGLPSDWTSTFTLNNASGNQPGTLSVTVSRIDGTAAPEPGSLALVLMGVGGGVLFLVRRRSVVVGGTR